jgi:hypothetical protein
MCKMLGESEIFTINCMDFVGQNTLQLEVGNEHLEVSKLLFTKEYLECIRMPCCSPSARARCVSWTPSALGISGPKASDPVPLHTRAAGQGLLHL